MTLEQIAEFEVFAEHVEALVAAEPLQLGRMAAAVHAGGQGAALEAVAAELAQAEAAATARAWTTWATVCGVIAVAPIRGRGGTGSPAGGAPCCGRGGSPPRAGSQIRRNTGPSARPACAGLLAIVR